MWEKIKQTCLIALATLGVLFIVLLLLPDDEDKKEASSAPETTVSKEEPAVISASVEEQVEEAVTLDTQTDGNGVTVNIPSSEVSADALTFKTVTLDNEEISQDIFSDYDITIVHVWGTFCMPCIAEMGEYAALYNELPENVNLIGIICDVYDGLDSNVSQANDILGNAGAEFTNLRSSDDLYGILSNFQYVPSSFFVDSEGHVIGELMDGAGINDTKNRLDGYLN